MSPRWKNRTIWLLAQAGLTVALHWLYKLTYKLGEHAVLGWGDDQIAHYFGITATKMIVFLWDWGPPFLLAAVTLYVLHLYYTRHASVAPSRQSSRGYRPTTNELPPSFTRWRWWYAIWGGAPFHFYKARKRLEFIDSWREFTLARRDAAAAPAKSATMPDFRVALVESASQIGDFAPVTAISITNIGDANADTRYLVELKDFSGTWPKKMARPLPLRTEGQIRGKRSGRFTLSKGQSKTIPLVFHGPIRKNEWYFFDEGGDKHFVPAGPMKLILGAYGGAEPWAGLITIDTDAGWNARSQLETVTGDFRLRTDNGETAPFAPTLARVGPGASVPDRFSLIEFRDCARQRGWKIPDQHSLDGPDLLEGLRQAGLDGTLRFWGRPDRYSNDSVAKTEPLNEVPALHWSSYQFDWQAAMYATENFAIGTYNRSQPRPQIGGYKDIYVEKTVGIQWLDSEAGSFRGRHKL